MSYQLMNAVSDFAILALVITILYKLSRTSPGLFTLSLVAPAIFIVLQTIGAVLVSFEMPEQAAMTTTDPILNPMSFSIGSVYLDWAHALVLAAIGIIYELRRRNFKLRLPTRQTAQASSN